MKAFITGVTGFTGRYMARCLAQSGYEVVGLAPQGGKLDYVSKIYSCNLTDAIQLNQIVLDAKPDVVLHLAAISFVAHGKIDEIYQTNVVGTRYLLEALTQKELNCRKILLASSANIYGNKTGGKLSEQVAPDPVNDYAVSKLAMEYVAKLYSDRLPIVITRPFNYTGVGQADNFLLPKIVKSIKNRLKYIELGNLDVSRDFSDVRMVVEYYRRLVESDKTVGNTYNVCSGKSHTLQNVIDMACSISAWDLEVKVNPAFVRNNEVKDLCGDPQLLIDTLDPVEEYSLQETLAWMLA